jgi:hypothetical protein
MRGKPIKGFRNTKHSLDGKPRLRICPKCHHPIYYKSVRKRCLAELKKSMCRSCGAIQKYKTENIDKNLEEINGVLYYFRFCPKCKSKIIYKNRGHRDSLNGKPCRSCWRADSFLYPNFNRNACKFFDVLNIQTGWNGKHALNGGEHYIPKYHYFLDYYEAAINLVIEWNEPHHKYRIEKDFIRRKNIIELLGCRFIVADKFTKVEDIIT